tara:strand:- start:462 stop:827 length:366 start_codon:yes stop_codon:yes gene_type:complete
MSILSAFNNIIINFLDDCILIFKDDTDFKLYKRGLGVIIKYNPKKVHTFFKEYLEKYRPYIDTRNDAFFLQNDFDEIKKYNNDEIFTVINKIKTYWGDLDEHNKKKVWDYFSILSQLSDKI